MQQDERAAGLPSGYLRKGPMAQHLGITLRCLTNWMRMRIVPYHKLGKRVVLFRPKDVDAAIERYRIRDIGEVRQAARDR